MIALEIAEKIILVVWCPCGGSVRARADEQLDGRQRSAGALFCSMGAGGGCRPDPSHPIQPTKQPSEFSLQMLLPYLVV